MDVLPSLQITPGVAVATTLKGPPLRETIIWSELAHPFESVTVKLKLVFAYRFVVAGVSVEIPDAINNGGVQL